MNGMLSVTLPLTAVRIINVNVTDDTLSVDLEAGILGWTPGGPLLSNDGDVPVSDLFEGEGT